MASPRAGKLKADLHRAEIYICETHEKATSRAHEASTRRVAPIRKLCAQNKGCATAALREKPGLHDVFQVGTRLSLSSAKLVHIDGIRWGRRASIRISGSRAATCRPGLGADKTEKVRVSLVVDMRLAARGKLGASKGFPREDLLRVALESALMRKLAQRAKLREMLAEANGQAAYGVDRFRG
ncbi:hypothetical protein KFL_001280100 [Klebsormidium nitens]|uniref:Uncharacterized protein n=1 Tax=Klebsormidium nitens TaxID=105231 RepID=A0A1Y1HW68_KLENI|nr:hypothetical protein KFL_001280100 [Klebsormidium nitens]|eukprot:GAQ82890.1 hypothetical protein KFL_001280100 [Klebsormidium nitens]